jgi:hypothetical protein
MAFLHRVVNSGGQVEREFSVGSGRVDVLVRWPYTDTSDASGKRAFQLEALELKVWRPKEADPIVEGLARLDGYLDRLGLATGVLVIFDRRPNASPIADRTRFEQATSPSGRPIIVLRA